MNDELTPLGEVIDAAQRELGWSNRELERQSDGMAGLGKSNIGSLKRKPQVSVKASTIKNLSRLLRIPEARIAQAVLDTMGIDRVIEEPKSLREAVELDVDLSSRDKRIVRAVLDAVKEEGDGRGEATPLNQAAGSAADQAGQLAADKKQLRAVPNPDLMAAYNELEQTELQRQDSEAEKAGEEDQTTNYDD